MGTSAGDHRQRPGDTLASARTAPTRPSWDVPGAAILRDLEAARLEHLVNGLPSLSVEPATDFRAAATIYRAGRRAGLTIRSLVDCLIAAQAIRHDVALIHNDVDYEVIAQLTPLRAISLR